MQWSSRFRRTPLPPRGVESLLRREIALIGARDTTCSPLVSRGCVDGDYRARGTALHFRLEMRGLPAAAAPTLNLALLIPSVGVSEIHLRSGYGSDEVRSTSESVRKQTHYGSDSKTYDEFDQMRSTRFTRSRPAASS